MQIKATDLVLDISNDTISFNHFGINYDLQILSKSTNLNMISYICYNKENGNNSELIIYDGSKILFKENDIDLFKQEIKRESEPLKIQVDINRKLPELKINYRAIGNILKRMLIVFGILLALFIILIIIGSIISKQEKDKAEKQRIEQETITQNKIIGSYRFDWFEINGRQQANINGRMEISYSEIKIWLDQNYDNNFSDKELIIYKYNMFESLPKHEEGILTYGNTQYKVTYYINWIILEFRIGNNDYEIRTKNRNFQ